MATAREIVASVHEALTNYQITDDSRFDELFILKKVNDIRAALIREEARRGSIDDGYYQLFGLMATECLNNEYVIGNLTIELKPTYRYVELPVLIPDVPGGNALKYFGAYDLTMKSKYSHKSLLAFISSDGAHYTGGYPMYVQIGNIVLVKNLPAAGAKLFMAVGLARDPFSVTDPIHPELDPWDRQYPAPDIYKLELLVKKDILATMGIRLDELNDNRDQNVEAVKQ